MSRESTSPVLNYSLCYPDALGTPTTRCTWHANSVVCAIKYIWFKCSNKTSN